MGCSRSQVVVHFQTASLVSALHNFEPAGIARLAVPMLEWEGLLEERRDLDL